MAHLITGKSVVEEMRARISGEVEELKAHGIVPRLGILRVGARADDISYEKGAKKVAQAVGVSCECITLPEDVEQETVLRAVDFLNSDPGIHGILLFRPLPSQLDDRVCCGAIDPVKDVDGATVDSLATVFTGEGLGYAPCTAQACIEALDCHGIDITGKNVAILGRSLVIGRPVAMMLVARNATPTICHTRTRDAASITRAADIVVVATGKMETIGAEYFSPGQVVLDVGINWNEEKQRLCGDVRFDEVEPIVEAITPVPNGIGAITSTVLVDHVVEAARRKAVELGVMPGEKDEDTRRTAQ